MLHPPTSACHVLGVQQCLDDSRRGSGDGVQRLSGPISQRPLNQLLLDHGHISQHKLGWPLLRLGHTSQNPLGWPFHVPCSWPHFLEAMAIATLPRNPPGLSLHRPQAVSTTTFPSTHWASHSTGHSHISLHLPGWLLHRPGPQPHTQQLPGWPLYRPQAMAMATFPSMHWTSHSYGHHTPSPPHSKGAVVPPWFPATR